MAKGKGIFDDLFSGAEGIGSGAKAPNPFDFSELSNFTNKLDPIKAARTVVWGTREWKARRTYQDVVGQYGPDVAEAAANAVRAGRTPDGILARAQQQLEERAVREAMVKDPPPVHGSARWATRGELAKRLKDRDGFDNPRSILLGAVDDPATGGAHFIHWDDEGHLVTLAPSRSGKSETTIIPNLLRYQGSVVVHDPKGELYEQTSAWRRTLGPVYRVNPYNAGTHPDKARFPQHGFNPLATVESYADARELAGRMIPPDPKSPAFFQKDAVAFLTPLIWYVRTCLPPHISNLYTVCRFLGDGPEKLRKEVLPHLAASGQDKLVSAADNLLVKYGGRAGEIPTGLQTFFATVNADLEFWRDPELATCTARNDVEFAALKRGSGVPGETMTIYVTLPFRLMRTSTPFLRMLFSSALNAMEEEAAPAIPVLFVMDEFLALGPFPEFERALREVGGYGVRLWFFLQELGKLQEHYPGTTWQAFFNTSVKQFFGTNEHFTADLISRMLSTRTVALRNTNEGSNVSSQMGRENGSAGVNFSSGESISLHGRPLVTPDEVTELLGAWNEDGTRNSIVQLNSPSRPVRATLSSFKKSRNCTSRLGAWMGEANARGGYPS